MTASFKPMFDIPDRLTDEVLTAKVAEYRHTRSIVLRDEIIESHIRLALTLAGRFMTRHPRRKDDLISASLLGLTQAVEWAPDRLYDNNITPYICITVIRFLRDYVQQDHVITVERRALKAGMMEGMKVIPYMQPYEADDRDEENYQDGGYFDVTPAVYDLDDNQELFNYLNDNPTTEYIMTCLTEGYTYQEIADDLCLSKQRIGQLVIALRQKADEWEKRNG